MRFFVKNRFDVHNLEMATDRHQAPSYPLRMPDELKAKIAESAEATGRSLHAELLVRLNESFRLNQNDADTAGFHMRIAEMRVKESQLMAEALHLASCATFLLQSLRGPDPKGALKHFSDLVEIADKAVSDAKRFELELNPRMRLKEYEAAISAAEELLEVWRPNLLPWPGDKRDDDEPAKPPLFDTKPRGKRKPKP